MDRSVPSVVEDQDFYATSCGYCKSNGPTSIAYGFLAHSLSPQDYQELLDRSWRRSGIILYRPESESSCCAAYTIRLKVNAFKKSKEHLRTLHRMERYLDGFYTSPSLKQKVHGLVRNAIGAHVDKNISMDMDNRTVQPQFFCNTLDKKKDTFSEMDFTANLISMEISLAIRACILHGEYPDDVEVPQISVRRCQRPFSRKGGAKSPSEEIYYTCGIAFLCSAELLKQKRDFQIVKNASMQCEGEDKIKDTSVHRRVASILAHMVAFRLQNHDKMTGIKVEACNGHLNFILRCAGFCSKAISSTFKSTHNDTNHPKAEHSAGVSALSNSCQSLQKENIKHTMEIHTTPSVFNAEEFSLYKRYQVAIHNEKPEDISENNYRKFLVDTPLTFVPPSKEGSSSWGFGSFHQQYLIDGRLVAVGVIDILPSCLSSNYFFWDPDFAFLSLGKYSALKEIELVQEANRQCSSFEYYYLGHYIHSCPKMHYKVAFHPSELLCPVRLCWVPFDLARPLLDKQAYVCLSDSLNAAGDSQPEHIQVLASNDHVSSNDTENMDFSEPGDFREDELLQDYEASGPSVDEGTISNVLVKIENHYMQFKQLQEWAEGPQESWNALMRKLHNYMKIVGASLASRMAYTLC